MKFPLVAAFAFVLLGHPAHAQTPLINALSLDTLDLSNVAQDYGTAQAAFPQSATFKSGRDLFTMGLQPLAW